MARAKLTPGDRIRAARKALGLTQAELAERLELDQATISRVEAGELRRLSRGNLLLLATALRIRPTDLDPWLKKLPLENERTEQ